MSCKVQQSVCSDCVTYVKSRIKFNTFNTFNNVGAYVAGYVGEKYIILGFHDYTGCILRFTSRVNKTLDGVYTSYRFAKLKYVEVVNKSADKK